MTRVVVPGLDLLPEEVTLPPEHSKYVTKVLRLGAGDSVTLLDGGSTVARGIIVSGGARAVVVRIESRTEAEGSGLPPVCLIQCLPKGSKLGEIIRRVTELGAASIRPALSERSVARPEGRRAEERVERWRKIAAEASRQCGRQLAPEVHQILPLEEALRNSRDAPGAKIILWEDERSRPLRASLSGSAARDGVTLVIGPEGGLTRAEVAAAREAGFETVTFGPLVLRTETAAVAAVAVVVCP